MAKFYLQNFDYTLYQSIIETLQIISEYNRNVANKILPTTVKCPRSKIYRQTSVVKVFSHKSFCYTVIYSAYITSSLHHHYIIVTSSLHRCYIITSLLHHYIIITSQYSIKLSQSFGTEGLQLDFCHCMVHTSKSSTNLAVICTLCLSATSSHSSIQYC